LADPGRGAQARLRDLTSRRAPPGPSAARTYFFFLGAGLAGVFSAVAALGSLRLSPPVTAVIEGSIAVGSSALFARSASRLPTVALSSRTRPTRFSPERSRRRSVLVPSFQSTVV